MTDEEILAELDLHQAWTEGALATIEADKEDREALRSDVRYLIDLNLKQASDVNEVLTWLTNSGSENLETLLRQALRWHWPEFWTGVGAGAAVIVIGGLLVPRLFGGD
jgi:hypothetical protein